MKALVRAIELRYDIVVHWTFRAVVQPACDQTAFYPPSRHVNLQGALKYLWWDFVRERFYWRYREAGVCMSQILSASDSARMGTPPIEDIAPGCAKPSLYEPQTRENAMDRNEE